MALQATKRAHMKAQALMVDSIHATFIIAFFAYVQTDISSPLHYCIQLPLKSDFGHRCPSNDQLLNKILDLDSILGVLSLYDSL